MRNKVITILISIIVVILILWIGHKNTLGEDGLITQASNVEIEYNKKEILTVLKSAVNEKYLEAYNLSKEDTSKKIEDFYNTTIVIEYLKEKGYIDYYYYTEVSEDGKMFDYTEENITEETQKRNDVFYMNALDSIEDITKYGKGKKYIDEKINKIDVFMLEKKQDTEDVYIINYYNIDGKKEEIGELNLKEPI